MKLHILFKNVSRSLKTLSSHCMSPARTANLTPSTIAPDLSPVERRVIAARTVC